MCDGDCMLTSHVTFALTVCSTDGSKYYEATPHLLWCHGHTPMNAPQKGHVANAALIMHEAVSEQTRAVCSRMSVLTAGFLTANHW